MDFLQISSDTAPTARTSLPDWPDLPTAHLSPGKLSSALAEEQQRWAALIDDTTTAVRAHTTALADFAEDVRDLDEDLATALGGGL